MPTQKIEIQKGEDLREKCADTEKRKRKRKKPQNKHRKEISFKNYRTVTN